MSLSSLVPAEPCSLSIKTAGETGDSHMGQEKGQQARQTEVCFRQSDRSAARRVMRWLMHPGTSPRSWLTYTIWVPVVAAMISTTPRIIPRSEERRVGKQDTRERSTFHG